MSEEIRVINAERKIKRDIRKVFNGDFLKIITEIILNADDSYKRMESGGNSFEIKPIDIYIDRDKRVVSIVDQAEGMSEDDLTRIFSVYGDDFNKYESNRGIRGLFGQGAGDVLHNSALSSKVAQIISFKDDKAYKCKFIFDKEKKIKVTEINGHIKQVRQKFHVKGNGTSVMFGLGDEVKIPSRKSIQGKIEEFYMLRYILSNPKREVYLIEANEKKLLSSKRYLLENYNVIKSNIKLTIPYDENDIEASLSIYEKRNPKDPIKILIRDNDYVVYEESYFDHSTYPGISHIVGELIIPEISSLIRSLINAEDPKELLTDTRDGFDRRNTFGKSLDEVVGTILEKQLLLYNKSRTEQEVDLSHNKALSSIMKQINSYYRELELSSIEGINRGKNPPQDGLSFARNNISITKGKKYDLKVYINSSQIPDNSIIKVKYSINDYLQVETSQISYEKNDIRENGLVLKSVILKGVEITESPIPIEIRYKDYNSIVDVNVVKEKIVYPENGLEFFPHRRDLTLNKNASLSLYFDTDTVRIGSKIDIIEKREMELFDSSRSIIIKKENLIIDTIGKVEIDIAPSKVIQQIYVTAKYAELSTKATIYFKPNEKDKDAGKSGILNKIHLKYEKDEVWQSTMDEKKGILYINASHIININNLGQLGDINPKKPSFKKEQQKYLLELIALESAKRIAKDNILQKSISYKSNEAYLEEIQSQKTEIYKRVINDFSQ